MNDLPKYVVSTTVKDPGWHNSTVLTGDVVSDSIQQFLRKHSKRCLSKPFSVDEFRQNIGGAI